MTSVSPSAHLSQASHSASQAVAPSISPLPSLSGKPTAQAAGSATATGNSTNANKIDTGSFAKPGANNSVNGRVPIHPAVPATHSPTIIGDQPTSSSVPAAGDHGRKQSVTISASGTQGYTPNGVSHVGKVSSSNNIQFGSMATNASPQLGNSSPQPNTSSDSLAVKSSSNPRVTSPQLSPSPIPQPPATSGGKPPSALHGHNNSVNSLTFGGFPGQDGNPRSGSFSQSNLAPGLQSSHLRRDSSHSQHSDMSNHGIGPSAGRAFSQQGGRGRGYGANYGQQIPYSSSPNMRPPPNRSGSVGSFPQQRGGFSPYPNSPHQQAPRQPHSPMPANAQPVPLQPGQMPMHGAQMPGQPQYYPNQVYGYPPNMGPQYVKPMSPFSKGPPIPRDGTPWKKDWRRENRRAPDQRGYPMGQPLDPSFMANFYGQPSPGMVAPPSPQPPNQYPHRMQPPYQGQYGPQPPAMSRTSSALSGQDRPSSSASKTNPSLTPGTTAASNNLPSASPAPKPNNFKKPKSSGIIMKDPNTGEVVDLKHAASPAPSTKSSNSVPATSTPPPASSTPAITVHARTESKSVTKTDGKDLREQLARQHREREEAEAKAAQAKVEEEQSSSQKAEDKKSDASTAGTAAKGTETAAPTSTPEKDATAKSVDNVPKSETKADDPPEFDEDEIARWEAEEREEAKREAEREAIYLKKKQAEKDEAARKEAEAFKMADEEMKRAEREAEEREEALIREREKGSQDADKAAGDATPSSKVPGTPEVSTPGEEDTPAGSGVDTPASDVQNMPPPERKASASASKTKPTALKLETTKPVEAAQPSAALMSLRSARRLTSLDIQYPAGMASPNPAINTAAKMGRFRYDKTFLLQFKEAFKEKPSENWSEKIRETVGDGSEPQSARNNTPRSSAGGSIIGSRQPSHRGPLESKMGAFGASGNRTLPAGTTSEQRFQASTRAMGSGRPGPMQNPLANYVNKPGAFPQPGGSIRMDRTPSTTSMAHPNSPRTNSQRGGSQRGSRASRRDDPKDNKTMPLTAGGNVKPIEVSASGWKPTSIGVSMSGPAPGGDGHLAPDVVQRKVKASLNKMTPNNFDKISDQILTIAHQSKSESDGRSLRQVIQLTFEKATDEAHWAEMYAQFCKRMLESMSPEIKDQNVVDKNGEVVVGGALFRKYLLTRCQTEFERGWKVNLPEKPDGTTEEAALMSDEYYKAAAAKRRGLGLVRFIGELYKLQMLTERIMHECVKKLVDYEGVPDDAEVESLTSLLRTIGQQLDSSEKGRSMMDVYFARINSMFEIKELPSRLRFMLLDIVDLRKKDHWQTKGGAIKGPTTIDAVRAEVAEAERQKEIQRAQENARKGSGRPGQGRGDARQFSGGGQFGMPPQNYERNTTVGMDDLRRLGKNAGSSRQSSTPGAGFGPPSMFASARGSNTRKPLNLQSANDSGSSSRVSTPPAQKKEKEESAKSSTNAFSLLASTDGTGDATSPGPSPALTKATPAVSANASKSKAPEDADSSQS